jgi:hypothetical protein
VYRRKLEKEGFAQHQSKNKLRDVEDQYINENHVFSLNREILISYDFCGSCEAHALLFTFYNGFILFFLQPLFRLLFITVIIFMRIIITFIIVVFYIIVFIIIITFIIVVLYYYCYFYCYYYYCYYYGYYLMNIFSYKTIVILKII